MKKQVWNILTQMLELLNQPILLSIQPHKRPIRWKTLLIRLLANWIRFALKSRSFESFSQERRESNPTPCERSRTSTDSFPTSPCDRSRTPSGNAEDKESR